MEIKTYPMKVAEGRVYAEITLRDVVERTKDLSDTPILAEIKRLYDENDKLRELVDELYPLADYAAIDASELDRAHNLMRELGIEVDE